MRSLVSFLTPRSEFFTLRRLLIGSACVAAFSADSYCSVPATLWFAYTLFQFVQYSRNKNLAVVLGEKGLSAS
ncbi:MAG: hypothetical protein IJ934_03275 [Acetobacter sp.]|nr:hypothetical protein [Acetobacter sp.]